jgi:phosphoribosylglycinamide formyltransferase-1
MKKVAIFASGGGTNAERTITELNESDVAQVAVVLTNNPKAGVIERAEAAGVAVEVIDQIWEKPDKLIKLLEQHDVDVVLLLGYLKLLPERVIERYEGHIVNQHPALLPKYGGKGMYGSKVHAEVVKNGEAVSGFSIHRVTPVYDEGEVLYQEVVHLSADCKAEDCERLVRQLELDKAAKAIREMIEFGTI